MSERPKFTVLCCDDEKDLCGYLAEELEFVGIEAIKAYSGNEALRILQKNHVDAIITDIRMPDGDGIQLLKEIKKIDEEKPVVLFITGFSDISDIEAFDEGAEAIFSKPIDYDALIIHIFKLLSPRKDRWMIGSEKFSVGMNIQITYDGFQSALESKLLNLGRGGLCIQIKQSPPQVGQLIQFKIEFRNGLNSPLEGLAICRWSKLELDSPGQSRAGFEFLELTPATIQNVESLISTYKFRAYIPK